MGKAEISITSQKRLYRYVVKVNPWDQRCSGKDRHNHFSLNR